MTSVSLVVCTYNRCSILDETLRSLLEMMIPESLSAEIIVVDNASSDATAETVEKHSRQKAIPVRYVFEPQQGVSYARNAGIHEAKGDLICFFDDDILADPQWLTSMLKLFAETDAVMAGCRILRKWECPVPEWFSEEVGGPLIGQDFGLVRTNVFRPGQYLITAALACRRGLFARIGGFREDLGRKGGSLVGGEDKEFFDRAQDLNESIFYEPDAVIYHRVEPERLTQAYMRRWFSAIGKTAGHQLKRRFRHTITGAPLWVWRDALSALLRTLRARVGPVTKAEKVASEMQLRYAANTLGECLIHAMPECWASSLCVFKRI